MKVYRRRFLPGIAAMLGPENGSQPSCQYFDSTKTPRSPISRPAKTRNTITLLGTSFHVAHIQDQPLDYSQKNWKSASEVTSEKKDVTVADWAAALHWAVNSRH